MAKLVWTQPCAAYRKCRTPPGVVELLPDESEGVEMPAYVAAELIVHGWSVVAGRWVCPGPHPAENAG